MDYTYIDVDFNHVESCVVMENIQHNLKKFGMSLTSFSGIAFSCDYIKKLLGVCANDLIIVRLSKDYDKNIALKNLLCECFNSFLVKNTASTFAIESYLRLYNGTIDNPENFENETLIPDGAEPLTSDGGFVQGFMMNYKNINLVFLPPELCQIQDIIDNKLPSIFYRFYKTPTEFMFLKTFGVSEEQLTKILIPFINNSLGVLVSFDTAKLDSTISLGYSRNIDEGELNNFVALVCESVKKYLYATEITSLYKSALDYIKLTNKKVAMLESVTMGKLFSELANTDVDCVHSNIVDHRVITGVTDVFSFQTVNRNEVVSNGLYNVDSAYEVTTAVINELNVDLAVCSLGKYDEVTHSVNCFLSIGDVDGVHIYKNTYKGELRDVQDIVAKNTCFYIIRKLKQNNLLFDQTI